MPRITPLKIIVLALLGAIIWFINQPRTPPAQLVADDYVMAEILSVKTTQIRGKHGTSSSMTTARVRLPDGGESVITIQTGQALEKGSQFQVRLQQYSDGTQRVLDGNSVL